MTPTRAGGPPIAAASLQQLQHPSPNRDRFALEGITRVGDPARAQLAAQSLRAVDRRLTADERMEIADVVDRLGREVSTARCLLGACLAMAYAAALHDVEVDDGLQAVA